MFSCFFFLMIRRPPRSTLDRSSAASDVYKRQGIMHSHVLGRFLTIHMNWFWETIGILFKPKGFNYLTEEQDRGVYLSLIHISEPTRPY